LEKQFPLTKDEISKEAIASALVRLGDHDVTYWDYLEKQARAAIESDVPDPVTYDSSGKLLPGLSPELVAWAKARHLTVDDAEAAATLDLPAAVMFIGQSKDRNAIPLLRRALSSPDVMIQTFAAQGLAELQDKASIPFIVEACRRAPADEARAIAAFSLARFDDPVAKNAAKEFMPAKEAK
jgi:HEAT repeat protein